MNIVDKVKQSINSNYKEVVNDYFTDVSDLVEGDVLDYGSGFGHILNYLRCYTSDIPHSGYDFICDYSILPNGKVNTNKKFNTITVLRNYIFYNDIKNFLHIFLYLKTLLHTDGKIIFGKHTPFDDFGDWNNQIGEWLENNCTKRGNYFYEYTNSSSTTS